MLLIVGGSDTGRAPLIAALLRRALDEPALLVASAGVLGHDGDTWQDEARLALQNLGITPPAHTARSLTPELLAQARLAIAVDRGTARAVELNFNQQVPALPELAGGARDILDPFRMTLDAWLIYARELDAQIKAALPAIRRLYAADDPAAESPAPAVPAPAAIQRLRTLVSGIADLPEVIAWAKARAAIADTLRAIGAQAAPDDLRPAAVAMLLGLLGDGDIPLTALQLAILAEAADTLASPVDAAKLATLAATVGRWTT